MEPKYIFLNSDDTGRRLSGQVRKSREFLLARSGVIGPACVKMWNIDILVIFMTFMSKVTLVYLSIFIF